MDIEDDPPTRSTSAPRTRTASSVRSARNTPTPTPTTTSTGSKTRTPRKKTIEEILNHKLCLDNVGAYYNAFDLEVKWKNNSIPEWCKEDELWDEHKVDILLYWGEGSEKRRRALTKIPTHKRNNSFFSRIDGQVGAEGNQGDDDKRAIGWVYVVEYVGYDLTYSEEFTFDQMMKRAPGLMRKWAKEHDLELPGK